MLNNQEEPLKLENLDNNSETIIRQAKFPNLLTGISCDKFEMIHKGKYYLVKLPNSFKDFISLFPEKNFSKYSMEPACEWLGSQIFKSLRIPAQNVELCKYKGSIVAACENFIKPKEIFIDFQDIYKTWSGDLIEPTVEHLTGREAIGINDIIKIISSRYPGAGIETFFWEMFIVDALIGNTDRNMSNWGILVDSKLSFVRVAPVFDNGSSFSKGWSDTYILQSMKNISKTRNIICNSEIPFVDNGCIITHNSYLNGTPDQECMDAIIRIVPEMDINTYCNDIDKLAVNGILSPIKADFYKQSLVWRYDDILQPALRQAEQIKQGGPSW